MAYASDAGHWYDKAGMPCYTIVGKNGKERNTTLRDARKEHYVPSVTEVLKVLAKPGLERWKLEQVKLAALTLPAIEGESLDNFSHRIDQDSVAQMFEARDLGTSIHGAIERYFQGKATNGHDEIVISLAHVLRDAFGTQEWYAENSFASELGFGGKVDLFSKEWVIDYKTKDFTKDCMNKKFSYDEHILQLCAYRLGLGLPKAGIANVFISRSVPGLIKVEIHKKDLTQQWEALLKYWQKAKNFDSNYKI